MDKKENIILFWGHQSKNDKITKSCLSQWYPCKFKENDFEYNTAEQYMMIQKAKLFEDNETLNEIIKAKTPKEYKYLGRQIKNFNGKTWNEKKFDIVVNGNMLKFSQNEELKNFLLSTNDTILAEASPYDKIWGIGIGEDDKDSYNIEKWKGENLLGKALMKVRDELRK